MTPLFDSFASCFWPPFPLHSISASIQMFKSRFHGALSHSLFDILVTSLLILDGRRLAQRVTAHFGAFIHLNSPNSARGGSRSIG